jgi:agmatinase
MPGGVTFVQARRLIHAAWWRRAAWWAWMVEITPRTDVNQITTITAGRLIVNLIGGRARRLLRLSRVFLRPQR